MSVSKVSIRILAVELVTFETVLPNVIITAAQVFSCVITSFDRFPPVS